VVVPSKQATILALLINEIVANAVKHGFQGRDRGIISITAVEENGEAVVEIANDGVAISNNFDPSESRGLGMRIVQRLVTADLNGEFHIGPTDQGSVAVVRFPIASEGTNVPLAPITTRA
jgi:two-component sensor histidine kinase